MSVPDYLVIVDFDVSCDASGNAPQEIIVFPWVVISPTTAVIVKQDQLLVKPRTKLSAYCTQLTSINNDQLATADTLDVVVAKFDQFLKDHILDTGHTFTLVCDGAWDLRQCLIVEAASKGIPLKDYYYTYFDVRKEFGKCHPEAPNYITNIKAIIEYLGIPTMPAGSGLPDCRKIASIVCRLLADGHVFNSPESFKAPEAPNNHRVAHMHWDSIVKLRGLPFTASANDIKQFFNGCEIAPDGVLVCLNPQRARATGEGFVKFTNMEQHDKALLRDRMPMGSRYVEVFSSSQGEYNAALMTRQEALRNAQGGSGVDKIFTAGPPEAVLRLRGLPFNVTINDIVTFLNGYRLADSSDKSIRLIQTADGRSSGEAYVQLESEDECRRARDDLNKQCISTRYIEIYTSSQFEAQAAFNQSVTARNNFLQLGQETMNLNMGGAGLTNPVVRMRGIPFSATVGEVEKFVAPAVVIPNGINMIYDKLGRHKGEAFVVLAKESDMAIVLAKNRQMMGTRYIEVFASNRASMLAAMGQLNPSYVNQMSQGAYVPNQSQLQQQQQLYQQQLLMQQQQQYGYVAAASPGYNATVGQTVNYMPTPSANQYSAEAYNAYYQQQLQQQQMLLLQQQQYEYMQQSYNNAANPPPTYNQPQGPPAPTGNFGNWGDYTYNSEPERG